MDEGEMSQQKPPVEPQRPELTTAQEIGGWAALIVGGGVVIVAALYPMMDLPWVRDLRATYGDFKIWVGGLGVCAALAGAFLGWAILTSKPLPTTVLLSLSAVVAALLPGYWSLIKEAGSQRQVYRDLVTDALKSNSAFRASSLQFATQCVPLRKGTDTCAGPGSSETLSDECAEKSDAILSQWTEASWLASLLTERISSLPECEAAVRNTGARTDVSDDEKKNKNVVELACLFLKRRGPPEVSLRWRRFVNEFVDCYRHQKGSHEDVMKAIHELSDANRELFCAITIAGHPRFGGENANFSVICQDLVRKADIKQAKDYTNLVDPIGWESWMKPQPSAP